MYTNMYIQEIEKNSRVFLTFRRNLGSLYMETEI